MSTSSRFFLLLLGLLVSLPLSAQKMDMDLFKNIKARSIGPAGMSGRVTSIDVVLSNPDIIYAGTASGGLWKSESGGVNWKPIFDEEIVASIGAVAVYQKNPSIVWAGTGEGNPRNSQTSGFGIFKSLDGGKNWESMGLENTRNIHRILIHPDNPDIVYAGVQGTAWGDSRSRGVFKTTDGGKNWTKVLYVNPSTGIGDLVMDPQNPNKLIAAMWEFRRWPWFFKSGGEGSGLYISHDGGSSWKKKSSADGLPEGELGRMGLAIAPSNPNIVYALIENKKNAFFRSDDGGVKWKKVNDTPAIGGRPFYYADIYVDPENENRIYSIHSIVSKSEDGGKSFSPFIAFSKVHPDYHAWWIHPEDGSFMMAGNDGGMAISHDRGKNWRFVENLPLAQFYHINIDNEIPYNVYGGMQDNGSWRGPAYVWRSGGIRNAYWEELFFGDGFDVVPHPENKHLGYAMSQGGMLGRYDLRTGLAKAIRPMHPEGEFLRYNWNAGIAQDPHSPNGLYYGSQYLHYSEDMGESWEIISPDLTTNDPEKQKQLESGGLTYDVTNAENYTTIIAVAPSPVEKDVIWVGTDDGNLQLSRDGGEGWNNLSSNLRGVPRGSWIPHIHASNHDAGEAFVVVNNYRRNDWNPYVYHTKDFGASWTRIVSDGDVWGYALSIVQDPVEEDLLFLGTEYGLYVSIDGGSNWNQWTHGYPTASTMDLKIHPREHDLIIGTFGRAAYVLDDIQPLRALAGEGADLIRETLKVYPAPDAYLSFQAQATGTRFAADAMFAGENRAWGGRISYSVNPAAVSDSSTNDSVLVQIVDKGTVIRNLMFKPDTGMNRVVWQLDQKGVKGFDLFSFGPPPTQKEPGGRQVLPGTYTVRVSYKGQVDSTSIRVHADPRVDFEEGALEAYAALLDARQEHMGEAREMMTRLKKAEGSIGLIMKQLPKDSEDENVAAIQEQSKAIKMKINELRMMVIPDPTKQGIHRDPEILSSKLGISGWLVQPANDAPNQTMDRVLKEGEAALEAFKKEFDAFFDNDWKAFQELVAKVELDPFQD